MATTAAPATSGKRRRRTLPPLPQDVPTPATFGDWYDAAAVPLGVVEKLDSGASRMVAGAVLLAGVSAGAGLLAEPLVVLLGHGAPGAAVDVGSLVIGPLLLLGVLAWWLWFRRGWVRARRLRAAWSRSIRDPRVLELPVRPHHGKGPDPEEQHDFRARERDSFAPYPGLRSVGGVTGGLDAVRAALYPLLLCVGVVAVLAALGADTVGERIGGALPVVPFVLITACATVRAWRRVAASSGLVALQHDDRRRWTGWRVLRGLDDPAPETSWYRRVNWVLLPVALGAAAIFVFRVGSGEMTGAAVAIGVGLCIVPVAVVAGVFLVRSHGARSRGGADGVAVRLLADDVPQLGPVPVAPGPGVLRAVAGTLVLDAGGTSTQLPAGSALVSGEPHAVASRRHWLMLPDGAQVPLTCAAVRRLRELADGAGLRVL